MGDRKCTQCGRPVLGHKGQCGTKCTESPIPTETESELLDTSVETTEKTETTDHNVAGAGADVEPNLSLPPPSREKSDKCMNELSKSMSSISVDIRQLTQQNHQILSFLMQKHDPSPLAQSTSVTSNPSHATRAQATSVTSNPPHTTQAQATSVTSSPPHATQRDATTDGTYHLQGGTKLNENTRKSAISGDFINLLEFISTTEYQFHNNRYRGPLLRRGATIQTEEKQAWFS